MSISLLFHWVYQRSYEEICVILAVCTLICRYLRQRFGGRPWWRFGVAFALAVWFGITLWATVLNRNVDAEAVIRLIPFHSYREANATRNWELLRSNFMNVALFYPGGLLFALGQSESRRAVLRIAAVVAVFALCSMVIEFAQYHWVLGLAEIDDVIHNTIGALFGCLAAIVA